MAKGIRSLNYTREDYEQIPGNTSAHVVLFQTKFGSAEYFVRLWINYDTHDQLITWGPMDADQVDRFLPILRNTYCHVEENYNGPYEFQHGVDDEEDSLPSS